jgi:Flp pilus assembly protein TadD
MSILREGLTKRPEDRDILQALMSFNRDAGDVAAALEYAERLARLAPDDRNLASLVQELRRQVRKPDAQ